MATYIQPGSARFKKNTLLFNLTESLFKITDTSVIGGHDIAFIFKEFSIYIELDPGLSFSVIEHDSGEAYGPYYDAITIVQKHVFGVYDNMYKTLSESFIFDEEIGAYAFKFGSFYYFRGSYNFGENIPKVARELKSYLPRIDRRFEYALDSETFFSDGAIELFLNRLNIMFNRNNFKEGYNEMSSYSGGVISRASGTAIEQSNGNRFFILNASNRRHAAYVIPKISTDLFLKISSGDETVDYVLDHYVNNMQEIVETNEEEIEIIEDSLGIELTVKEFRYKPLELFDDILLILFPNNNVRIGFYFVRLFDGNIAIIEFDSFKKEMIIKPWTFVDIINNNMDKGRVTIVDNVLEYSTTGTSFTAEGTPSVKISARNYSWATYPSENKILNEDGNIYSFQFAKNLLHNIFSGD